MADKRIPARQTNYKGITMRSRLEARFAGILDELGMRWEYEGPAFASGRTQYVPDFTLAPEWTGHWYIEVKPYVAYEPEDFVFVGVDDWLDQMRVIVETPYDGFNYPQIAVASPALGDFLYCEYEWPDKQPRTRGLAAFFREEDHTILYPLFGDSTAAYFMDGFQHLDWSW